MLWSRDKEKKRQMQALQDEIKELRKAKLAYAALATSVFVLSVYLLTSRNTALVSGNVSGMVGGGIVALFAGIAVLYFFLERRLRKSR